WIRNSLGVGYLDEAPIVLDELLGVERRQALRVHEQVLFDFITYYLRQHQPADFRCAKRQRGFVESPGRDNSSREDVGIKEEAGSARAGHFRRWVRERRGATLAEAFFP